MIALNSAPMVTDLVTGTTGTPMFVMAGACPSVFAGMQAVVYTSMGTGSAPPAVDFWWLKPRADATALEEQTLNRHGKGNHKNDPGASKKVYAPIAALFGDGVGSSSAEIQFGLELTAQGVWRATLRPREQEQNCYLLLVWQEAWTTNPLSRTKFIQGKLLYQKGPTATEYYACPYRIDDDAIAVHFEREELVGSDVIPTDAFKLGCE